MISDPPSEPTPVAAWLGLDCPLARHILNDRRQCLDAYRAHPRLVLEHANIEIATAQGGYGRRQIYELVQNGADELLDHGGGRIEVLLTTDALYCANEGDPLSEDGVYAILASHLSKKRGSEIGRFGMGFKSVLGVTTRPEIYSQSGSFRCNPAESERLIRAVAPGSEVLPRLRIAEPVDPAAAAQGDVNLAELQRWATTVIKLPLDVAGANWLSEDIESFPREFLLFCPHVSEVSFEDRNRGVRRTISLRTHNDRVMLEEGEDHSVWKVFKVDHIPSATARADAGELAARDTLPLAWAVPMQGRLERGVFWAFFPTEYYTTLSGKLNAPWKTNEDRQNLLTGVFNEEMIDAAARLIARSLPGIVDPAEPGRFLDLLPARGREAPNWADALLTEKVYEHVGRAECLPDQNGMLGLASSICLHPAEIPKEALEVWAQCPIRPTNWCHHTVETSARRSRVERLVGSAGQAPRSLASWLEALVKQPSPAGSKAAIRCAAIVVQAQPKMRTEVETARIVLTSGGVTVAPRPGAVFLPVEDAGHPSPGLTLVHPELAADSQTTQALGILGIGVVDATSGLKTLLATGDLATINDADWERFWKLARRVLVEEAIHIIRGAVDGDLRGKIKVRTRDGRFRPLRQTLLPGAVVSEEDQYDAPCTVDSQWHVDEMLLLTGLGAGTGPTPTGGSLDESWAADYRNACLGLFQDEMGADTRRPQEGYLQFDRAQTAGPLEPLLLLGDAGRARFTAAILPSVIEEATWTLAHQTRRESYPRVQCIPPSHFIVLREGRLPTSFGLLPVGQCVGPELGTYRDFLPVADCTQAAATHLRLPTTLAELLPSHWAWSEKRDPGKFVEGKLADFYAALAEFRPVPAYVRCRVGSMWELRPPDQVCVAVNPTEAKVLSDLAYPYLEADSVAGARLRERWGLQSAAQHVSVEIQAMPNGPDMPLLDQFPGLQSHLPESAEDIVLVPCSSLRREVRTAGGRDGEDHDLIQDANRLLFSDQLTSDELLQSLAEHFDVQLDEEATREILDHRKLIESRELTTEIRGHRTLAGKLLAAVGPDALVRSLPRGLLDAVQETAKHVTAKTNAELALAVYGVDTLRQFRQELEANGLKPPASWAGSHAARNFVKSLGFPAEFAGFEQRSLDRSLEVLGPPQLNTLHAYQEKIVNEIRLMGQRKDRRRAVISLPTGAGKTRVAVEGLIRLLREHEVDGPILWIAQTAELCEQAVQTWNYVWRSVGPSEPLMINRLWATNEADAETEASQVVVATIAKLQGCFDDPSYDWLSKAAWVVIDEAHGAIEKSYTAMLRWQGLTGKQDRCPLLGLTATPFKGGEEETERLVQRFGGVRLDHDAFDDDPYAELQEMGVLARVDHQILKGSTLELSDRELENLEKMRLLPAAAGDRLGADVSRNEMLLDCIRSFDPEWPVLLFAVSVEHAQTMAAMLTLDGISAAVISGQTEVAARRHYIEEFRRGRLRVLTNFAVLAAGFDAPSVRAIVVARPTYSPALYQQMIGRGLRGPLNGGKERCLIVNVEDNINRFGDQLAFRQFEHLWEPTAGKDKR